MAIKTLTKLLDFSSFPQAWILSGVSLDWEFQPLVLFEEGRSALPDRTLGVEAFIEWSRNAPLRHHLLHGKRAEEHVVLDNPDGLRTSLPIQPFDDGWLFAEARGGIARTFKRKGDPSGTLKIGDGIERIQTTPESKIWVGYFDEGVYGGGMGSSGLLCFDPAGTKVFDYLGFAKEHQLPFIDDCYALNVFGSEVWLCYYSDFPLVSIKDSTLQNVRPDFGPTRAFAIRGEQVVSRPAYKGVHLLHHGSNGEETIWELVDPLGSGFSLDRPFTNAMRGDRILIYDRTALYELIW